MLECDIYFVAGAPLLKSGIKEGSMVDAVVAVMEKCFYIMRI